MFELINCLHTLYIKMQITFHRIGNKINFTAQIIFYNSTDLTCQIENTKLMSGEASGFLSLFLCTLTLFIARKHDARFLVSDVTVQYGGGNLKSFRILKRKYTSQHARNITETKDKTDLEKWPKSPRHPCSSPPCTSKMNDKLPFPSEGRLGMPTTNPRIKLFNGKAGSSELFFGKRDVLGFPIHFARPPADKSGG